ncbi:MAG: C-terminal binding protein [Peptostreptococcaceae bacterium]|nr:C-terminal binding protein [Peptostreptococcaceae bacterium]
MSKFTVVVSDSPFPDDQPFIDELNKLDCEIIFADLQDKEGFYDLCGRADGMIVTYADINAEVIGKLKKCKVLARTGVAVNNIDVKEATKNNIYVTNVATAQVADVSNHAVTLLLTSVKKIPMLNDHVKNGNWSLNIAQPIHKLSGSVLGLAGFGHIAKEVSKKVKAFGIDVIAYDPYVKQEVFDKLDVKKVEFDELVTASDFISIHLPLNEATKDMFGYEEFEKMKPQMYIINTARGGIINEEALIDALDNKKIAGAGLDVLATEFPGKTHPLYKYPNVIITPHSAYYSEECVEDLQKMAANEIVRVLSGEKPFSLVNKELL